MKKVQVPGIGILSFPDEMSNEEMHGAIQKNYPNLGNNRQTTQDNSFIGKVANNPITNAIMGGGDAAAKGIRHAASAPSQFVNPFVDAALGTNFTGDVNTANQRMDEEYNRKHPRPGITAKTISNVSEGLPALLMGGGGIPSVASKGLARLGNMALYGAASSPLIYDESGKMDPLEKTGIGAASGVGAYGLSKLGSIGKSLSGKIFNKVAGEISEPEFREVMEANKGLKTGIGNLINAPYISKFQENALTHVPFSGVENAQLKTANKLTEEGNNILNNLLGDEEKKVLSQGEYLDVGSNLKKSLKKLEEGLNIEKNELYLDFNKIGKELGVKVNATNYQNEAKNILESLKHSRPYGKLKNTDKEEFENFLKDISSGNVGLEPSKITKGSISLTHKNVPLKTGYVEELNGLEPIDKTVRQVSSSSRKYPTPSRSLSDVMSGIYPKKIKPIIGELEGANYKIKDLRESAQKEFISSNKFIGGAYNKLEEALRKDLNMTIDESGSNELRESYSKAQKHYAENIGPFEDKDILKFTRKGADTDTLVNHFIRVGKNDRGNLLGKLVDKLTPQERNTLAYDYFRPAFKDGANGKKLMPRKMLELYNKLGDKTKDKLFTPEFRKEMKRYGIRVGSNNRALEVMSNPNNGGKLSSILSAAEVAAALVKPMELALPLAAMSSSANAINKGLNSEWIRDMYLKGYQPLAKDYSRKISAGEGGLTGGLNLFMNPNSLRYSLGKNKK